MVKIKKNGVINRLQKMISSAVTTLAFEHQQGTMIAQRVMAIARGWEDLHGHQRLRNAAKIQEGVFHATQKDIGGLPLQYLSVLKMNGCIDIHL